MWKITKDYMPEEGAEPGTNGNALGVCSKDWDDEKADRATVRFRMYTDDDDLVYEGVMSPGTDFHPLDDFGTPNFGCTELRYLTPGKTVWELL